MGKGATDADNDAALEVADTGPSDLDAWDGTGGDGRAADCANLLVETCTGQSSRVLALTNTGYAVSGSFSVSATQDAQIHIFLIHE